MWLFWCIYLVTGNIAVTRTIPAATAAAAAAPAGANPQRKQPLNAATQVAFKNFAPFKNIEQKSITLLLMKQILLTLQSLCTIWSNIMTIILILQEV